MVTPNFSKVPNSTNWVGIGISMNKIMPELRRLFPDKKLRNINLC